MKIVVDTNVLVAAIWGRYKSGKSKSYNMKLYELILQDEVDIFSCNDLIGEIMKTFSTDPDLKATNRQYFYARFDELTNHFQTVSQVELIEKMATLVPQIEKMATLDPELPKEKIKKDAWVISLSNVAKVKYLITHDKDLLNFKGNLEFELEYTAVTPEKFFSIENRDYWYNLY